MITRLAPFLTAVIACLQPVSADTGASVLGSSGDELTGHVAGISNGALMLESPDFFKAAALKLSEILEVNLPARHETQSADHIATLTLTNGDILRGQLISVTQEEIGLRTSYAGDMIFRRSMVDQLQIQEQKKRLYFGPASEPDWKKGENSRWSVGDGFLQTRGTGSIGKIVKLNPKAHFSFDLAWRQNPRFRFMIYSNAVGVDRPDNSLELVCQNRYVYLRKTKNKRTTNLPGNADAREFTQGKKAHVEIFADTTTGVVRLVINNRVVSEWADPDPGADFGNGIQFSNEDSGQLRVSRLEISEWDGSFDAPGPIGEPEDEEDNAPPPETPQAQPTSRIKLKNNDEIDGETIGIENGIVKIRTSFGDAEIPVSRLKTFALHTEEQRKDPIRYEIPRLYAEDIRGWFPDGSRVTLRLKDIHDGKVDGFGQPFGNASFDFAAFQKIEFNLYRESLAPLRSQDRW